MRSIRGKLLFTLLFIALLSTGIISFVLLKDSEKMAYSMIEESSRLEIKNIRDFYFEKLITDIENIVLYWSKDPALCFYEKEPGQGLVNRSIPSGFYTTYKKWMSVVNSSNDISWIYYGLEDDGSIFVAPVDITLPKDYDARKRAWYSEAKAQLGKTHWIKPYLDAGSSGEMLLTVAKAVVRDNEVVGVFAVDIPISRLNEMLTQLLPRQEMALYIVNQEGSVIAGTDAESHILGKYSIYTLKEEQSLVRDVEGKKQLVTVIPFENAEWVLIGLQPLDIDGIIEPARLRVIYVAIIQLLVTLMLGFLLIGRVLKPLETLLKVIEGVSKGDIKQRARLQSKDEFGDLSRGFDTMLDNIEDIFYERDHHLKILKKKNKEIVRGKEEIIAYSSQVEAMNDELSRLLNELGDNYLSTVKALANAIEASDDYTRGHCERVGEISRLLGDALSLPQDRMKDLVYACVLHDIGKIAISDKILNKRMPLTKDELSMIKMHPLIGYEIIKDVSFLKRPSLILLQHHERIDGFGYPYGLAGPDILLEARILSVADAYDAMTSARAYRQSPLTKERVLLELEIGRGNQFDIEVVDALIELLSKTDNHL